MGAPSSGGNSANRTATGINAQGNASGARISYQIENMEEWVVCPALYAIQNMNMRFLNPEQIMQITGQDGKPLDIDPLHIMNANVRFEMQGAQKLKTRAALSAGGLQFILQYTFNPEMTMMMAKNAGKVPNLETIDYLVCDVMGIPDKSLWMDATPQIMQALNQPSPDKQMAMQMQQERLQAQGEHIQEKGDIELLKATLSKILENHGLKKALTGFEPEPPQQPKGD
jgi:hypothetical protein